MDNKDMGKEIGKKIMIRVNINCLVWYRQVYVRWEVKVCLRALMTTAKRSTWFVRLHGLTMPLTTLVLAMHVEMIHLQCLLELLEIGLSLREWKCELRCTKFQDYRELRWTKFQDYL